MLGLSTGLGLKRGNAFQGLALTNLYVRPDGGFYLRPLGGYYLRA